MRHCDWPDCKAPLNESDISHDKRCRYCLGRQGLEQNIMKEIIKKEAANRFNNNYER